MPRAFERFLRHGPVLPKTPTLGRAYAVTRETWRLTDDPKAVRPALEVLVTRKTASEAADLAREAAEAYEEHGFHKPSGAWWGSDGELFHRFAARPRPRHAGLILAGSAALALTAALLSRRGGGRRRRKGAPAEA
jgi:hypothetical protein